MNIGIIVYSQTGHTLSVAGKLKDRLVVAGYTVNLEQVEIVGQEREWAKNASFKTKPAISAYDALVFGSPVRGGVLPPPMMSYLEQIPSLQGKKIAFLVTGFFPAKWGRNQTIAQMKSVCEAKGTSVSGVGSVGWFSLNRKQQISEALESLGSTVEQWKIPSD